VASDHPDDKYKKLTDFGDSGAEIDHIWPKAKAGSNAFSNAQVISSAANKGKTDK
jgi:5-methylcytosine-specific restriction endonuclease McrA